MLKPETCASELKVKQPQLNSFQKIAMYLSSQLVMQQTVPPTISLQTQTQKRVCLLHTFADCIRVIPVDVEHVLTRETYFFICPYVKRFHLWMP